MNIQKTNAMRILDKAKIPYEVFTYESFGEAIDGNHVAAMLNQNPEQVFKTLVTITSTKEYAVFVLPVNQELDVKKGAKALHTKSIELIHVKDINRITGYIRGGCSPIGMKKRFQTVFHETCRDFETIICSGGKIGFQIAVSPTALCDLLPASYADIIKA